MDHIYALFFLMLSVVLSVTMGAQGDHYTHNSMSVLRMMCSLFLQWFHKIIMWVWMRSNHLLVCQQILHVVLELPYPTLWFAMCQLVVWQMVYWETTLLSTLLNSLLGTEALQCQGYISEYQTQSMIISGRWTCTSSRIPLHGLDSLISGFT